MRARETSLVLVRPAAPAALVTAATSATTVSAMAAGDRVVVRADAPVFGATTARRKESPMSEREPAAKVARPMKDGIGWGDPFCVTAALPDSECEIDECEFKALWTVEAMGCDYDGEAPEQGPTADACAGHVSTLMERWTW